ncbi:MAG: peroxide stress protein YaaA, partial [Cellvibrionales bacterium]
QPQFLQLAAELVEDARRMSPEDIQSLMGVSENIAALNHARFMNWHPDFTPDNAKQAVLAFKGDVYTGLEAESLDAKALTFAQKHLRILSGLYGLLRPLDLMQPYRLEMGLKFANRGGSNLYEFWGEQITEAVADALKKSGSPVLVNLASNEYFKSIKPARLDAQVVTPVFKDLKNGQYKMISFFAKKARGVMARYIVEQQLNEPEAIKSFTGAGYYYSAKDSSDKQWVFLRDDPSE